MKKFIKNILFFVSGLMIYFIIILVINLVNISRISPEINSSRTLILGDSHTAHALNPDIFKSAQNLSQGAEPYIVTYWKLQKVLNDIDPDTVIIGFNHYNISGINDLKFSDERWSNTMFKRSFLIEDFNSIKDKIQIDYFTYYKFIFRDLCLFPHKDHIHYIGKYKVANQSYVSNSKERILRHYYVNNINEAEISLINLSYLDSIIEMCFKRDIVPVLVETPVHSSYYKDIPSKHKSYYESLCVRWKANNKVIIIRGNSLKFDNTRFLDSDHLSPLGSTYFTKYVINFLDNNE